VPTEQAVASFTDQNRVTHTVTVSGESLYTIAAAAIAAFRRSGVNGIETLLIEISKPARVHTLEIKHLEEVACAPWREESVADDDEEPGGGDFEQVKPFTISANASASTMDAREPSAAARRATAVGRP
jgi:hypothetical protein